MTDAAPRLLLEVADRARRALVAEDDPLVRAVLVDALRIDGWLVEEAADGEQLLGRVLAAFPPGGGAALDLIIADVWLPFCTGLAVVALLRAARRATPVVLVTADHDPALHPAVDTHGCVVLEKPFTFEILRRAVRDAIG